MMDKDKKKAKEKDCTNSPSPGVLGDYIITVNEFTEESARNFRASFFKLLNDDNKMIPIVIDSYGGYCDALISMVDTMLSVPEDVIVPTICTGKAMSCGGFLLGFGTVGYRFCGPLSRIMMHEVWGFSWGSEEDLESYAAEIKRLQKDLCKTLSVHSGQPSSYFWDMLKAKRSDIYLTGPTAKRHKLIDHVKMPILRTNDEIILES